MIINFMKFLESDKNSVNATRKTLVKRQKSLNNNDGLKKI